MMPFFTVRFLHLTIVCWRTTAGNW